MIKTWIYVMIHPKNEFNLSNLYPIDGTAFLLTQVCLVCPWVLHNGQITDHMIINGGFAHLIW